MIQTENKPANKVWPQNALGALVFTNNVTQGDVNIVTRVYKKENESIITVLAQGVMSSAESVNIDLSAYVTPSGYQAQEILDASTATQVGVMTLATTGILNVATSNGVTLVNRIITFTVIDSKDV